MATLWEYDLENGKLFCRFSNSISQSTRFPDMLYRFVKKRRYAKTFVRGSVRIGTLEAYRKCEQVGRGDKGEGIQIYNSGVIRGDGTEKDIQVIAQRSGIYIDPTCKGVYINNNTRVVSSDAYVLCLTTKYMPADFAEEFGRHCIQISNPLGMFVEISRTLSKQIGGCFCYAGQVVYDKREYCHLEQPPGPIGFVKPQDLFEYQAEFRMLWHPKRRDTKVETLEVSVPAIGKFCSLKLE